MALVTEMLLVSGVALDLVGAGVLSHAHNAESIVELREDIGEEGAAVGEPDALSTHAQRVTQAVGNEQAGGLREETLWAAHARLRAENEAWWDAWTAAEPLSEAHQKTFAAPGSISATRVVHSPITSPSSCRRHRCGL